MYPSVYVPTTPFIRNVLFMVWKGKEAKRTGKNILPLFWITERIPISIPAMKTAFSIWQPGIMMRNSLKKPLKLHKDLIKKYMSALSLQRIFSMMITITLPIGENWVSLQLKWSVRHFISMPQDLVKMPSVSARFRTVR